jgi:hypothetical protein
MLRKKPWMLLLRDWRPGLLQIPLTWTLKPRKDLKAYSVSSSFYVEHYFSSMFLAYMPGSANTISAVSCMDIKTVSILDCRSIGNNLLPSMAIFSVDLNTSKDWLFFADYRTVSLVLLVLILS